MMEGGCLVNKVLDVCNVSCTKSKNYDMNFGRDLLGIALGIYSRGM
jgi:hypothetical protein